jgi:hypothetical protein
MCEAFQMAIYPKKLIKVKELRVFGRFADNRVYDVPI